MPAAPLIGREACQAQRVQPVVAAAQQHRATAHHRRAERLAGQPGGRNDTWRRVIRIRMCLSIPILVVNKIRRGFIFMICCVVLK